MMGDEETVPLRDEVVRQLERTKWFLWHGNVYKALQVLQSVLFDLEMASCERDDPKIGKLCKAVQDFYTYIESNQAFIPNYGERYRTGERISTGFAESTVNQVVSRRMVKKQQMRWSNGSPLAAADSHARAPWRLGGRLSQRVSGIPCVYAARVRVSLAASPLYVPSASVRRPSSKETVRPPQCG